MKRYRRHVSLDQTGHIVIDDLIETDTPRTMSEVLHSDTSVQITGEQFFRIDVNGAVLKAMLQSPRPATTLIEPNIVMGPGRPGSVDKGSLEPRGERLIVSTPSPVKSTQFHWDLRF